MDTEPLPDEGKPVSKLFYWILGALVVGTIFAAASFMYYRNVGGVVSEKTTPTDLAVTKPKNDLEAEIKQADTDLSSLSDEIDQQLAEIDDGLASSEDDTSEL
jgi:hypothetical protein